MHKFGKHSLEQREYLHPDLKTLLDYCIARCPIDFGIRETYRPIWKQQEYYSQGRTKPGDIITKIDGVKIKSKHNYNPALAADLYVYVKDNPIEYYYDPDHLIYLAGYIQAAADMLFEQGKMKQRIRWGGNWDMDGIIVDDQDFDDLVHIELI